VQKAFAKVVATKRDAWISPTNTAKDDVCRVESQAITHHETFATASQDAKHLPDYCRSSFVEFKQTAKLLQTDQIHRDARTIIDTSNTRDAQVYDLYNAAMSGREMESEQYLDKVDIAPSSKASDEHQDLNGPEFKRDDEQQVGDEARDETKVNEVTNKMFVYKHGVDVLVKAPPKESSYDDFTAPENEFMENDEFKASVHRGEALVAEASKGVSE